MDSDEDFEEFFRMMIGRAIASVSRIERDPGLAEDAAVEALARAHLYWRTIGSDPHREAWVLRVAINAAIDAGRRNRRHRRVPDALPTPSVIEDGATDRVWVADELARLPRRQREAVALRYLADLSENDVAEVMGISQGSGKTHVHRGLKAPGRSMHEVDERGVGESEVTDV